MNHSALIGKSPTTGVQARTAADVQNKYGIIEFLSRKRNFRRAVYDKGRPEENGPKSAFLPGFGFAKFPELES